MGVTSIGRPGLLALAICAAACVSPNRVDEEPLIAQSEVDVQPRLKGCGAGYAQPAPDLDDPIPYVRVSVPVIVAADGTVESIGTPQLIHSTADVRNMRLSSSARDEARYRAESCVFEPALLEGIPVSARYALTFVVPA
jgi:hypothetical protein